MADLCADVSLSIAELAFGQVDREAHGQPPDAATGAPD
jgi:hypothetical protein